jgi:hypothetical protein
MGTIIRIEFDKVIKYEVYCVFPTHITSVDTSTVEAVFIEQPKIAYRLIIRSSFHTKSSYDLVIAARVLTGLGCINSNLPFHFQQSVVAVLNR